MEEMARFLRPSELPSCKPFLAGPEQGWVSIHCFYTAALLHIPAHLSLLKRGLDSLAGSKKKSKTFYYNHLLGASAEKRQDNYTGSNLASISLLSGTALQRARRLTIKVTASWLWSLEV